MKAIIQDIETELEKVEGKWVPKNGTECTIESLTENKLFVVVEGKTYTAVLLNTDRAGKNVEMLLNCRKVTVHIKEPLDQLLHNMGLDAMDTPKVSNIKAPMPGLVLSLAVQPGSSVSKGETVLVLEAMKMENSIKAAGDGIVARILVQKGETVDKNQVLIEFS